jgi:hypothetical protein
MPEENNLLLLLYGHLAQISKPIKSFKCGFKRAVINWEKNLIVISFGAAYNNKTALCNYVRLIIMFIGIRRGILAFDKVTLSNHHFIEGSGNALCAWKKYPTPMRHA